ncbi:lipase secretion chaperone [Hyalangium rubrum]|uniref:Lipase helper protein n=1 Tax=Hyalangium rubrum TaxID=3103134 RepID=A0ABU5HD47_9BACT|nr:lipase secretion chaperone [Hyalangium sp. s54d21]MDY7231181.1 lipase secretion chaperone [Hyalangium sp. s54d21]
MLPEAEEIKAQLLAAKAQLALGQAYERAAAHGDFALAPGRILRSLLAKRCGLVQRHASAGVCRELLFSHLKERLGLPEDTSQARFWEMLEQVDAAYERLVVADPAAARDEAFRAAYGRFREARRAIVGPELDRHLFGLADEVLLLPFEVDDLLRDARASAEQKLAAYESTLQRIEREHGVRLASVVEPVELAKHALRIQETAGPLGPEQQRAVLERYAGTEVAQRYLEHQREQQDRSERLRAFNQERDQLLEQLSREGLTPEQRRQRMAELDPPLFEKYRLR